MSDLLIEAHGLGKKYHRGYFARRGRRRGSDEFWALKDVDLELRAGEALGIIGPNGAGKSTLLKILSRVTTPTEGWMSVRGRVGALIELGAGFHPELSGRDNIYIAGSILGMSRKEITRRFEEIVEFSEIGEFIDMPVKKYSNGMHVRLGFAVAAHMDPEILLVDEVLAVGDGSFQKKCFNAMQRFREQGVSVILVSHSLYSVQRNCGAAVLLVGGRIRFQGATNDVIGEYQAITEGAASGAMSSGGLLDRAAYPRHIEIIEVQLLDGDGRPLQPIKSGQPVVVRFEYVAHRPYPEFTAQIAVYDSMGTLVAVSNTRIDGKPITAAPAQGVIECAFDRFPLTTGRYHVNVGLLDAEGRVFEDDWDGLPRPNQWVTVVPDAKSVSMERWRGIVNLPCRWSLPCDSTALAVSQGGG